MSELRWHPLLREWVAVAANRQDRPQLPKDSCAFCPGSGKVPAHYDVWIYPNDFAAFSVENPPFESQAANDSHLHIHTGARGACDVVLYHPDHNLAPSQIRTGHWLKVVELWKRRFAEHSQNPDIAYVYIFENTGIAIGVTMPHPHGQIYAFPFLPPLVQRELDSASQYYGAHDECLYCRILREEGAGGKRIVAENNSFASFVPYWARWPAEVQLYAKRHVQSLLDLTDRELRDLAELIKTIRMKYDALYGFAIPLMMVLRQRPVRGDHPYFHFHIEFLPIQRSATKIKYLAGIESGAGTFLNDTVAEEKAAELRSIQGMATD